MAEDGAGAATAAGDAPSTDSTAPAAAARPGEADRSAEDLLSDALGATDDDLAKGDDLAAQLKKSQAEAQRWRNWARKHEDKVKELTPAAARLAEIEEASKTEAQKLADRATAAEQRAAEADARYHRTMAAASYGLPRALMSSITGSTEEEANASAEALAAAFNDAVDKAAQARAGELASAVTAAANGGNGGGAARGQRPVEAMRAGALPAGATVPGNANDWMRQAFESRR